MNAMNVMSDTLLTMSSVEIAELTGKQHKHVKTDIVKLLNELELRHADFSESLKNNQNQSVLVYNLPKRECLILVSGYSIKMRAAIIDRWQSLEEQQSTTIPATTTPVDLSRFEILQLAMQAEEERLKLAQQVEQLQPTVSAFGRIAKAEGSMCVTDAAKQLQCKPKQLFNFMSEQKWIYRRSSGKNWIAYQAKIQQGLLEHKANLVMDKKTNTEKTVMQVRVTPKGLTQLAKLLDEAQTIDELRLNVCVPESSYVH